MTRVKRREETADSLFRIRILSRYITKWGVAYKVARERKYIQSQHEKNRQKMNRLLSKMVVPQQVEENVQKSIVEPIQQVASPVRLVHQQNADAVPNIAESVAIASPAKKEDAPIVVKVKKSVTKPVEFNAMEQRAKERKEKRDKLLQVYKDKEEEKEVCSNVALKCRKNVSKTKSEHEKRKKQRNVQLLKKRSVRSSSQEKRSKKKND